MTADEEQILWAFARGDLGPPEFEPWLYAQPELEAQLGSEFYNALIFADYRSCEGRWAAREMLRRKLGAGRSCECPGLKDVSAIPMTAEGLDVRVFSTLQPVRDFGEPLWWLYLSRCRACSQHWLVAQDDRIYDSYYLKRLSPAEASGIVEENWWPDDFITFERVLSLARKVSEIWTFMDPRSPALIATAKDLRTERPEISDEEIAYLLGITASQVADLA